MPKNIRSNKSHDSQFKQDQAMINYVNSMSNNILLNTGALVIKGVSSALAKTANIIYAIVAGTLVKKAAADMAALAGTVTNGSWNVYCFFIDSAGVLTTVTGTEGATIGAVVFPEVPLDKVLIGFVIINPTGTGDFVGGTTALDDATVVPNAVYIDTVQAFKPNGMMNALYQMSTE